MGGGGHERGKRKRLLTGEEKCGILKGGINKGSA